MRPFIAHAHDGMLRQELSEPAAVLDETFFFEWTPVAANSFQVTRGECLA
jgi:hypothetical protein